jgi:VIT1/CCC1 family predicted Fe2+/Mn2+ transporter
MDNPFAALYKSFSNAELLQIVEDKDNYQTEAVEAAINEIERRRLTSAQWEVARGELGAMLASSAKKKEQQQQIRERFIEQSNHIMRELSPSSDATIEKRIRLICYGIGLLLLYTLIKEHHLLWRVLKDFRNWDTLSLLMLLPYIAVPLALYYFWHKHLSCWIVLTAWLTVSVISVLDTFVWRLKNRSGFTGSLLYPRTPMQYYIVSLLIFGGLFLSLNASPIRDQLRVSRRTQVLTVGISSVFMILFILI